MKLSTIQWALLCTVCVNLVHGQHCMLPDEERFDCNPELESSQKICESRGCCWIKSNTKGVPQCFYPENYDGYRLGKLQDTKFGLTTNLTRTSSGYYPKTIKTLKMDVYYETGQRLHFKIFDPDNKRYEVPIETPTVSSKVSQKDYEVNFSSSKFGFSVVRSKTQRAVFNSSVNPSGLLFHDQFIQISTSLTSHYVYGLGEHRSRFLLSTNWSSFTFWNNGFPVEEGINLYGTHPFYLGLEPEYGTAYGVFLLNSNAMDVVIQPTPAITFRTIGGILDFYIFLGPTPSDVIQQYLEVIGHPFFPPYWGLGFHLCRWGYLSANRTLEIVNRMRKANIPQDTQWNDIDYMDSHLDFTIDHSAFSNLGDVVADIHHHNQHYIAMIDPAISSEQPSGSYPPYDEGVSQDVFIKDDKGAILIGQVWPGKTAFPDFFKPETVTWWSKQIQKFYSTLPLDGIWLDMNEPSSFVSGSINGCPANTLENPPYTPYVIGGLLRTMTLCASVKQNHTGLHYNLHSLYGLSEIEPTNKLLVKLRNKRPFIISRSTFVSSGKYAGHWLGDNRSRWPDMYFSITGILNFNMFGIPLVGADICGFQGNTNEELCVRWHQLGAFYPFSRNHNSLSCGPVTCIDQDPGAWSSSAQDIIREALTTRYLLLPYLYTLFAGAHENGTTVVRPLFFEYPSDPATYSVDRQFLWGSSLLISPVLEQGATSVESVLPAGVWYDFYNGTALLATKTQNFTLDAPLDKINLHLREGSILPLQKPNTTTYASRKNGFELRAAINSKTGNATGSLYWDDGDSIGSLESGDFFSLSFSLSSGNTLVSKVMHNGYKNSSELILEKLSIYGVKLSPQSFTVNGKKAAFTYDGKQKTLLVSGLAVNMDQTITAKWI
ncbi:Lysosomal alpha-glucosidase [Holothuria leucospilota]|uniref:Lysosomal alpha-glucosidase n=1 Tax=Holothuria leucospilota TaxID=206669 RepID=A0A9Q1H9V5_HOLLE|nr:Lysosomal alpha-glucosidase [Holothuria leucospilota]